MMRSLDAFAVRNISKARLRSFFSILVVMLSVAMLIATDGFSHSMKNAIAGGQEGESVVSFTIGILDTMLKMINGVMVLAAAFLIFNAFMMSITQRQQQIGMLRSIGMTRKQVIRLVLIEGAFIGIVGTVLGMIMGPIFAKGLIQFLLEFGGDMFTTAGAIGFSTPKLIFAGVIGISITLFSALYPAWRATKISPLSAMRQQSSTDTDYVRGLRPIIAAVVIGILFVYLMIDPPGKWVNAPQDMQLSVLFILIWLVCLFFIMPLVIDYVGRWSRTALSRRWKATGRLIADNVGRERQRVTLTALTMAVSVMMIISITGVTQFLFFTLLFDELDKRAERTIHLIMPFDMNQGMSAFTEGNLELKPPVVDALNDLEDIAGVGILNVVFTDELAPALFKDIYTYVIDADSLEQTGDVFFTFTEGSWETALPILREQCGVLAPSGVASMHNAGLGDIITVDGKDGPVDCVVAGIGQSTSQSAILSDGAVPYFDVQPPLMAMIIPNPGNEAEIEASLEQISADNPELFIEEMAQVLSVMKEMTDSMVVAMNGILLLAILTAALSVVNTTMMSIHERRHELGLLRAIGSTRKQAQLVIVGEAALIGLVGSVIGLIAGLGMTIIFVVTYGGNGTGIIDLPLWSTAFDVIQPALFTGVFSLIVAPLISAGAAWISTRQVISGTVIDTLYAGGNVR